MGRPARKNKRQSLTHRQAAVRPPKTSVFVRRWLALPVVVLSVAIGLVWYSTGRHDRPVNGQSAPSRDLPPEPPPIDLATVLGVSKAVPNDVEGLRGEVMSVCATLVRELPDRPEAHSLLALTCYRYGLKDQALEAWRQAQRLNDKFSPAQLGIGLVATDEGRDEEAIAAFRQAIALNPSTEEAYAKLIEVLLRKNQAEEALVVGREFARRFPESRKATYWLGQCYLQLERYEEAIAAHQSVIRQHPDLTPSYYSLAVALARLGRREEASAARAKFAELKQKDLQKERDENRTYVDVDQQRTLLVDTHLSAGNVYLCANNPIKAEAHWLRGIQVREEELSCRRALAALYESQQRWRSAAAMVSELVERAPAEPGVWLRLAGLQARLGKMDEAEAAYRQAIAVEPEEPLAYVGLLRLSLQADRILPDGVSLAQKAVELVPSPDSQLLLCTILEQSGNRKGALAAIEKAMQLAPNHPQLRQVYEQLQESR